MARITCWDGVGSIGGNKILLEDAGRKLWLDFGLDFGRMGRYYEEFVKPKGCLGLYEPVQMGLLPPVLDLYRPDLVSCLADPWQGIDGWEIGAVDGILISHAHVDHIGALSYVREDIPIYSSAMTLAISKATQDSSPGGISGQYCYLTDYEASDTGELRSAHHAKNPSRSRQYCFVDESPSAEFAEFWQFTPGSLSKYGRKHEALDIRTENGLHLKRFPVDHSVYGACAWGIETEAGWMIYGGDMRCHGNNAGMTWRFAEEAAKLNPVAMIIEGTRIDNDSTYTESQVLEHALEKVKATKGLVVADFGPRNIERLTSFLQIAKETGRTLLILPKDAYLLEKMALVDPGIPSLDDPSIAIYCKYEAAAVNWRKLLKESHAEKLVQPWEVAQNQEKMIACFSFFDVNELAYIRPVPGSTWLYSSCEAFSEDMKIDFDRLGEWVKLFGMDFPYDPESPLHVSGHACRTHLLQVAEMVKPKTLIPVHSEHPEVYVELFSGKVTLPERGVPIDL